MVYLGTKSPNFSGGRTFLFGFVVAIEGCCSCFSRRRCSTSGDLSTVSWGSGAGRIGSVSHTFHTLTLSVGSQPKNIEKYDHCANIVPMDLSDRIIFIFLEEEVIE